MGPTGPSFPVLSVKEAGQMMMAHTGHMMMAHTGQMMTAHQDRWWHRRDK